MAEGEDLASNLLRVGQRSSRARRSKFLAKAVLGRLRPPEPIALSYPLSDQERAVTPSRFLPNGIMPVSPLMTRRSLDRPSSGPQTPFIQQIAGTGVSGDVLKMR